MAAATIRDVNESDAPKIAEIYAHHVLHGTATFDTVPPIIADWEAKIRSIAERGWPFIAGEIDGAVEGYAYQADSFVR